MATSNPALEPETCNRKHTHWYIHSDVRTLITEQGRFGEPDFDLGSLYEVSKMGIYASKTILTS